MTKINHNRPELRYRDNLKRALRQLEAREVADQDHRPARDDSDFAWESDDPAEAEALNVSRCLIDAALKEYDLFAAGLSLGRVRAVDRQERRRLREEAKAKWEKEYEQARADFEVAAERYVEKFLCTSGALRNSRPSKSAHKILKTFHTLAKKEARKGSVLAITILETIEHGTTKYVNKQMEAARADRL